jgi:hypothetical protein
MNLRKSIVISLCSTALLLVVGAAIAPLLRGGVTQQADGQRLGTERKMPLAIARHMKRLQSIPGLESEHPEGPGSADAEEFLVRAYPDDDIPLARLDAARAAAGRLKGKFPTGKGRKGTWVTVGPSNALYPFTQFRNSFGYVPNRYVAGGRSTAVAIDPNCRPGHCRLWVFAAGGGVWRAKNALSGQPHWEFLSGEFGIQSGSSITLDPNDPSGDTLYVGTGEANASGDSAAGVGMYKSTDGGDTWTGPLGVSVFNGRAIGSIAVVPGSPNIIYAATTRGVLGVSSVSGGAVSLIPGAAPWGLYKSTDGGNTWTFLHNGAATAAGCNTVPPGPACSVRGVRRVALDPSNPSIVYAGSYSRGIWRSSDAGATWTQIKPTLANHPADANMRPEFAVTTLANGKTRMYVYEGSTGGLIANPTPAPPTQIPPAQLFRSDDVASGVPVFASLSNPDPAHPGYGTHNLCGGQCWYDEFVYTPAGYPDIVYAGGSYAYGEQFSNKRGVVLSTDAGVTSTDMTMDGTDFLHPNGLHPDQHAIVTNPANPFQFFEVNDGGVMRSSGEFTDVSSWCDGRNMNVPPTSNPPDPPDPVILAARLARCRQLLSRVPTELVGMNKGLSTLQFQSLSVSPFNVNLLQGGTQDNGTWQTPGSPVKWENTMIGDGGQSGFDAASAAFRFHTFFNATPDVNFSDGDIADWNWIADQIYFSGEPQSFYVPIISDPITTRSMFVGLGHVWRTKTWGMGADGLAAFRARCNEWFGVFDDFCGDWEPLGATTYTKLPYPNLPHPATYQATRLTFGGPGAAQYGTDRSGGFVAAVERATGDGSTLWAATSPGRVFISKNADANPASSVTFTRLDSLAPNDPNRFVSGIHVDPANANRAWISYSGFNATTPTLPGHVFEVTYNPLAGSATWVDVSYDFGDIPATDVARDDVTGDLYAATDFGVFLLAAGTNEWEVSAPGMPNVEVAGLTIVPSERKLYAATHGLSAWLLNLP